MEGFFRPGTVLLGKYRIESVLGRGGMGMVVRVTHLQLGEELALKVLSPEVAAGGPDVHARFLREAQSAVRLRGEHVTRVSDVGVLPEGAPYIVMEYLRGVDLSGELRRRGVLSPGEATDYVLQACEALAEAHAHGIVHRDIKPSNLFLTTRPDGTPLLKVLDFGISKAPVGGGALTRTDAVMGTPGYMSPEQMKAARDVDARADIWALGIVLYESLNGRRPFDAEAFSAIVLRAATEPPPPMDPRIPRGLQAVVLRCLEKDRAARFPSMAALAAALAPFARDTRAAAIIVERTIAMLQGRSSAVPPGAHVGQAPSPTTLSGSAGMIRARSVRRWYAMVGAVLVVTGIAVVSAVRSTSSSRSGASEAGSAVRNAGSAHDLAATQHRIDAGPAMSPAVDEPSVAERPPTAPPIAVVPPTAEAAAHPPAIEVDALGGKGKQKVQRCAELEAQKNWQRLRDCASELATLGAKDKAEEFRVKAVKETESALAAGRVQLELRDGNLRKAQQLLAAIGTDSVYFTTTGDAFRTAETQAIDDARRKALALANAHDCAGLRRFQEQIAVSLIKTVSDAVAVKCTELAEPVKRKRMSLDKSWNADSPFIPIHTTEVRPSICNTMNVEDIMQQAANQYAAEFAPSALRLMARALACQQDVKMYRVAAMYACGARDAASAKAYFANVPPQFQSAIIQKCDLAGIELP